MSYPWIHERELAAARAEHEVGDILDHEGRAEQLRIEELMERDPEYRTWADAKYLERYRTARPHPEPDLEAEP